MTKVIEMDVEKAWEDFIHTRDVAKSSTAEKLDLILAKLNDVETDSRIAASVADKIDADNAAIDTANAEAPQAPLNPADYGFDQGGGMGGVPGTDETGAGSMPTDEEQNITDNQPLPDEAAGGADTGAEPDLGAGIPEAPMGAEDTAEVGNTDEVTPVEEPAAEPDLGAEAPIEPELDAGTEGLAGEGSSRAQSIIEEAIQDAMQEGDWGTVAKLARALEVMGNDDYDDELGDDVELGDTPPVDVTASIPDAGAPAEEPAGEPPADIPPAEGEGESEEKPEGESEDKSEDDKSEDKSDDKEKKDDAGPSSKGENPAAEANDEVNKDIAGGNPVSECKKSGSIRDMFTFGQVAKAATDLSIKGSSKKDDTNDLSIKGSPKKNDDVNDLSIKGSSKKIEKSVKEAGAASGTPEEALGKGVSETDPKEIASADNATGKENSSEGTKKDCDCTDHPAQGDGHDAEPLSNVSSPQEDISANKVGKHIKTMRELMAERNVFKTAARPDMKVSSGGEIERPELTDVAKSASQKKARPAFGVGTDPHEFVREDWEAYKAFKAKQTF